MKRVLTILFTLVMAFTFVACGNTSSEGASSTEIKYVDDDFITDVGKALEGRWAMQEKDKTTEMDPETSEYVNAMQAAIDVEIDTLSKYRTANFKDGDLQELAIKYLNLLDTSKEDVSQFTSNFLDAHESWTKTYDERTKVINTFVNKYNLTVSKKYEDTLLELTTNAKGVEKQDAEKEKVQQWVNKIKFEDKDDGTGYHTYSATIKNDTGINFDYLDLQIDLVDKDGVTVDQEAIILENVRDGQTYKGEFFTDKEFDHYVITPEYTVSK